MRLRLSDAATAAVLAEHYRTQAEMCHQMARMTVSPFQRGLARACCRVDEVGAAAAECARPRRETRQRPAVDNPRRAIASTYCLGVIASISYP
jgi:hypothetical protein